MHVHDRKDSGELRDYVTAWQGRDGGGIPRQGLEARNGYAPFF
jgi:hypothetical protein